VLRQLLLFLLTALMLLADAGADAQFSKGLDLAKQGRLDEAEQVFRFGLNEYPDDKRFPTELAGIAWRRKNAANAKHYLRRALRLDAADEYANEFLGTLYLRDSNLPATLKYWNRIGKPLIQEFRIDPPLDLDPVLRQRTFAISGGQIFRLSRLTRTVSNLSRLEILSSYRFELTPRADERYDLQFRSVPATPLTAGIAGRILPILRGLPFQTIHFDRYNIAERAIAFTSLWRWDSNKRRIGLRLSTPFRNDPRLKLSLFADARDERWTFGFQLRRYEFGGEFTAALSPGTEWTSGLSVVRRSFRNGDGTEPLRDTWSFEWPNRFAAMLWHWPERRVAIDGDLLLSPGRLLSGQSGRYLASQANARISWYPHASGDDLIVRSLISAGRIFGAVPLDRFYILGMERDNPLWIRGHLGTRDGQKGSAPMGTQYMLIQYDVSRTIFRLPFLKFAAGPFYDTGTVADASGRFGSRGWMHDAGLSVTVKAISGLEWTFVYGRNLRDGGGVFYAAATRTLTTPR
jgi:tetratricopeptide (TPR) repeat protein